MIDLEWLLAILYFLGGLNDVFLDLVFYIKPLRRALAQGRVSPTASAADLHTLEEQPIAILVPAWDESAVIAAMLESTCDRLEYSNYDLFVGTYPNDEATQFEVARAAFDRPRIHRVVCPNPGPTSKADCLNWIVEAIKLKERETGKRYAIFTLQDAEDVVDPLTLKVFNRFVPEYDLIQIPVIPYERGLHQLTGGTYLDEFAEVHLKGLHARVAVGGMVPSAGVGTAFGRDACDELAAQTNNVLFPPVSLTEDYDFSFRLFRNGRKSGLAEVWVDRVDAEGKEARELVAIREFFPARFTDAVRQKQRWMLGITFQGWEKLGWGRGWRERYMLLRDRVGVLTSFLNMAALIVLCFALEAVAEAEYHHAAWNSRLGRFLPGPALNWVMAINLVMLLNRVLQRAFCVSLVARPQQMLMTPFRLLWSNIIDFYCAFHAVRRYTTSRRTGRPLKWLKTAHEFPSVESLLHRHRPLGDLLLEARRITPAQLRQALDLQARTRGVRSPLGELLITLGFLSRAQLEDVLATQNSLKTIAAKPEDQRDLVMPEYATAPLAQQEDEESSKPLPAREKQTPTLIPTEPVFLPARSPRRVSASAPLAAPTIAAAAFASASAEHASGINQVEVAPAPTAGPLPVATPEFAPAEVDLPFLQPAAEAEIAAEAAAASPAPTLEPATSPIMAEALAAAEPAGVGLELVSASSAVEAGASRQETFRALDHAGAQPLTQTFVFKTALNRSPAAQPPARRFSMLQSVAANWQAPLPHRRFVVAIGTRPEAIKLAPLVRELRARASRSGRPDEVFVCATGQHEDMVDEALALFGVRVDLNLRLMVHGQSLASQSATILANFGRVLDEVKPEWVIVQGDTSTTAMASLAAFYAGIRVAHVEAGLRTHDLSQPFPEEFNRRMVSIYADMHFAATTWGRDNLLREGVSDRDIVVTGNTGIDALVGNCNRLGIRLPEAGAAPLRNRPGPIRILVTAHRRENLESGLFHLCAALRNLTSAHPGKYDILWPLHPNPRVGDLARQLLAGVTGVTLTAPASYDEILRYLSRSDLVLTDSGGLQEEAPSFGKPVLILRRRTERPEGIRGGVAWLVGTDRQQIEDAVEHLAAGVSPTGEPLRPITNPYGDGHAAARIADFFEGRAVHEFGAVRRSLAEASRRPVAEEVPAGLAAAQTPRG